MSPEMQSLLRELGEVLGRYDASIGFGEVDGTLEIFILDDADGEALAFGEQIAADSCERMADEPIAADYEWLADGEA